MYVITHHHDYDEVLLGPIDWNARFIGSVLRSDLDLDYTPPVIDSDKNRVPYEILPNVWARIVEEQKEELNPKIQFHVGPYWSYTEDNRAIASYVATYKDLDGVKGELKQELAAERYRKEVAGVKVTIQDTEVTVDTNRGDRDIFVQKYLLMSDTDTVQWKFPEAWLTLTKADLGLIVATGASHVQSCFDWEAAKVAEIDACVDHSSLLNVIIKEE